MLLACPTAHLKRVLPIPLRVAWLNKQFEQISFVAGNSDLNYTSYALVRVSNLDAGRLQIFRLEGQLASTRLKECLIVAPHGF